MLVFTSVPLDVKGNPLIELINTVVLAGYDGTQNIAHLLEVVPTL
jgi:hypothetical protein